MKMIHGMNKSDNFFPYLSVLAFIFLLTGCSSQQVNEQPNILILFVDDMGYGDVGVYNEDSKIPTPNIDGLAEEGMRFMHAHAPGAVCHPSRYGLLTGRYPFRTNTNVWPDKPVIEEGRMTIASLLQEEGYRTAMVGKWHLGFDESQATDPLYNDEGNNTRAAYRHYQESQQLAGGPADRGFDSFFGIRASTDIPPYFYIRDDRVVNPPSDSIASNFSDGWTDIQGAFWREGGIASDLDLAEVLPRFTEEAVAVIENHSRNFPKQPLMLYVALPSPHTPWLPSEAYQGTSGAGMYGDFMAMGDGKVGEILKTLEQLNMSEETLVIFTSDNGPVWFPEDVQRWGHDSAGGLRGMKGDAYEAGHRMPFIVRWPGVVQPGSRSDQVISFTDVLATFSDILSKPLPEGAGEDSFSLFPVLKGEHAENKAIRPPVVSLSARGIRSIQDQQWKLIEGLGSGGFSQPAFIEPEASGPQGQLYSLTDDSAETNNLWDEHPEVVERLTMLLRKWEQAGQSRK